jgi:hypothetical protein
VRIEDAKDGRLRPVVWLGFVGWRMQGEQEFSGNLRLYCVPKALERSEAFNLIKAKCREYQVENTVYFPGLSVHVGREDILEGSTVTSRFRQQNREKAMIGLPPLRISMEIRRRWPRNH